MPNPLYEQRLATFAAWIRPTAEDEALIQARADQLRKAIGDQARAAGLHVAETPKAGSFAKNTGLRRHITGGSAVEGLDVDLVFVVRGAGEHRLTRPLDLFASFTQKAFPEHSLARTNSSIRLALKGARLSFDIVPMLATEGTGNQLLVRGDGSTLLTSVEKHRRFVATRTDASNRLPGAVRFNECVRLLKWWRAFQAPAHPNVALSSFLLELLCARAFDQRKVRSTHHETLVVWLQYLAELAAQRQTVAFTDFGPVPSRSAGWAVLDPVTPSNNVVEGWNGQQIDALSRLFAEGAAALSEAQRFERQQDHGNAIHALVKAFGPPIKQHGGV